MVLSKALTPVHTHKHSRILIATGSPCCKCHPTTTSVKLSSSNIHLLYHPEPPLFPPVIDVGTAGITIASRLAEDPTLSVAIIEAGGFYETDSGNVSTIPELAFSAPFLSTAVPYEPQPLVDWSPVSVPQVSRSITSNVRRLRDHRRWRIIERILVRMSAGQARLEMRVTDLRNCYPFVGRSCPLAAARSGTRRIRGYCLIPWGGPPKVSWSK